MREMLMPTSVLAGMGLDADVALITDGRFKWCYQRCQYNHVSPEAAEGGPIAFVKDGDMISINMNECTLTLEVSDEELEQRKKDWICPEPKIKPDILPGIPDLLHLLVKAPCLRQMNNTEIYPLRRCYVLQVKVIRMTIQNRW